MTKADKYISITIFVLALSLYIATMPPTVFWQDAGIYATGIYVEGNVYPPGYPLYMIVGEVWKNILPIGQYVQKIHVLSALFTSISSVFAYLTVDQILRNKSTLFKRLQSSNREKDIRRINDDQSPDREPFWHLSKAVSIIGTILFTLNYNVWAQANNAEVYAFHMFFFTFIVYIVTKIGLKGRIEKKIDSNIRKIIYIAGLVYGLSFGNHPMTIVLVPTLLLLAIMQSNIFFHTKTLVIAVCIFVVAALVPYAYLPLKASTAPPLNWGNPNTIERFVNHVSGQVYLSGEQSIVFNDTSRYIAAWQEFMWEFSYIGIALAAAGAVLIYRQNKTLFGLFISIIISHIFFAIFYKQTTEYNSWLIPAHYAVIVLITVSFYELLQKSLINFRQKQVSKGLMYLVPIALFAIFWFPNTFHTANELNRSNYYYAEDFGKNIIRNLDQNSLIFLTGDQESSTVMYLQLVQKYRPDIIAIKNIEFEDLLTPEGHELLQKRYPALKLPPLSNSNQNIDIYLNQLIAENLPERSVYTMSKSLLILDQAQFTTKPAAAMWQVEPSTASGQLDLKYWNLEYHDKQYYNKNERPLMSLRDPSKPGGINRVPFIQHMINFELQSWKNLGDWYLQKGVCDEAKDAYNKMSIVKATVLNELPQIQQNLNSCYDQYNQ